MPKTNKERLQDNNLELQNIKTGIDNLPDMPDIEPIYATGDLFTLNFSSILPNNMTIYSCYGYENYYAVLRYNPNRWEYYDLFFFKLENGQLINLTPNSVKSIYYYYISGRFGILYAGDDFIDYVYGDDRYSNPVYRLDLATLEETKLGNWNNWSYLYSDRYTIMRGMGDNKSTVSVSRYNPDTHSFVGGFSISYAYGSGYFAPDVFEFNDDAKTKVFRTIDTENDTVTYASYGIKNIIGMNFAKTKVFKSDGVYEYLGNGVVGNKLADLNIASQISGNICCRNDKYYTASYNTSSSSGKYRFFTFDEETNMFELVMEVPCYSTSSSPTSVVGGTVNSVVFRNGTIIACEQGNKEVGFTYKGKVYMYGDNAPTAIDDSKVLSGYYVYNNTLDLVEGTMPNNGELNYTPTTSSQSIPVGYTSGGTISAVTSAIDQNIQAENIKKDVEILGVTGTLEGTATPNIYVQTEEPTNKNGIWLQTDKIFETILQVDSVPTERQADTSPKPSMIYMQELYSTYYNNAIYVFGSYNGLKIAKYNLTNQTVSEISLGITASSFRVIERLGNSVYFFKYESSYPYFYEFNLETEQTTSASTSLNFDSSLYTTDGTYIYGVGTSTGSGSGAIYKYDLTNSTKTKLGSLPVAFYNGAVVCKGNYLYCFGGNNSTANYTYKFNISEGTATQLTEWSNTNPSSSTYIASSSEDVFIAQYPKIYIYNIATDTYTTYNTNGTVYAPVYVESQGKLYYFNYSTIYAMYDKVTGYPDNSLIITKGSREHSAELFDCELFQSGFIYDFGDVYIYTTADGLDRTIPTYYGDGTSWVKFKN